MGSRSPRIAIVGKGALGLLYGSRAARALGPDAVVYAMDAGRLARHAHDSYTVNGEPVLLRDLTPEEIGPVDLVIVAVKNLGLPAALDLMGPLVGPGTHIVSVLNGISSEEAIAARYGWDRIVMCVAQGMDAMRFGTELTYTQYGKLHIGLLPQTPPATFDAVRAILDAADLPYLVEDDITYRLWAKFMLNVGINQTCAAYGITYGQVVADPTGEYFRNYVSAMREVIAVAAAEGVTIPESELTGMVALEKTLDPAGTPSMGQDVINRCPTEVDTFAGEVMRRAARHGILVPVNAYLYQRIREIETGYTSIGAGPALTGQATLQTR